MKKLIEYIEALEADSFEGWPESEKQAYLTACISIKMMAKNLCNFKKCDDQTTKVLRSNSSSES